MRPLTVSEVRDNLTSIVRRYREEAGDREAVVFGTYRRAEAVILPFDTYDQLLTHSRRGALLDEVLDRRDLVLRIATMNKIDAVSIFGSVARREETADSDIDFLVDPMPGTTHFDLAQFQIDMEKLFRRRIDIVSRGGLDPEKDTKLLHDEVRL